MSKIITYSKEAREKLIKGIDAVADAVKVTVGPKGRNVILGSQFGCPQIINDGVTIAKEIELSDPLENAGAQLLKEVSLKTNDAAGDGTSTATILAQSIIHEGLKKLNEGCNPIQMKDGINEACKRVVEFIKNNSVEVDDTRLKNVATISSGNNEEIGELIAEAIKTVGPDGVVTVQESGTTGTSLKKTEGVRLDRGYISPYFVNDHEKQECVLDKPFILCVNKKINLIQDLVSILDHIAREGKSLLIIAEDVEGEALATLVVNTMRKIIRVAAIKAPGFGDGRKNILEDICILTNGTLWTEELGITMDAINPSFFGQANRVVVSKDETTIVVGSKNEAIEGHVKTLKAELEKADGDYAKEKLQERIARLTGGVAVIEVGAATEVELKEKKLRIEDALNATKAAQAEGIVAGGGYTLLQAQKECARDFTMEEGMSDFVNGYELLIDALSLPAYQIAQNAGQNADEIIKTCKSKGLGYNALTNKYENLVETGVIDPAKVTRSALQNAASIASMLLTTEAAIVEEPATQENSSFQPAGSPSMMM